MYIFGLIYKNPNTETFIVTIKVSGLSCKLRRLKHIQAKASLVSKSIPAWPSSMTGSRHFYFESTPPA